jgi:hypothetical protein
MLLYSVQVDRCNGLTGNACQTSDTVLSDIAFLPSIACIYPLFTGYSLNVNPSSIG